MTRYLLFALSVELLSASLASAGIIAYDESVSGDFSNSGLTPTVFSVGLGSNQVYGTTGRSTAVDRDYFSFTIPSGEWLTGITLLPGTQTIGASSFIGIEAGSQVTLPTNATTAAGLLGWDHYTNAQIGTNILPVIGSSGLSATDFSGPLPAGTYSFWVQETGLGTSPYAFDFVIATPEPKVWPVFFAAFGLFALRAWRCRQVSH
jgi:hypothetical protein